MTQRAFATSLEPHAIGATLAIDGLGGFELVGIDLAEGLSDRVDARAELATSDDLPWDEALGRRADVAISGPAPRSFRLELGEAAFAGHQDGAYRFVVRLLDPLGKLALRLCTRKFRLATTRDIVAAVLDEHAVVHRWQLSVGLPRRKYCVQYRESDLAFVERLLEFDGIHYWFDGDGTMVIGDTTPAAELLPGELELIETGGAHTRGELGIHEASRGSRVASGRVTLADYNWKRPDVLLRESAWGERDLELERYDFPAGFRQPERGNHLAKLRAEALRAESDWLDGKSNVTSFGPGRAFRFASGAGEGFGGEWLLARVRHRWSAGDFAKNEGRAEPAGPHYENEFRAVPRQRPWRPPLRTPRPTIAGSHTAMVRGPAGEEIHTDEYGRYRAQFHWDREASESDADSRWLRTLQETSSSMVLARTGWETFVSYVDGDPDRPIGVGRAINAQMAPTLKQPANKTAMTMRTPSSPASGGYSEVAMDDAAGAQNLGFRAEKDMTALVKNDKAQTIGNDESHTVGADKQHKVLGNQNVTIGANDSLDVGAASSLQVHKDRKVAVGGSESVDVGSGARSTIGAADAEKVGSVRSSIVGSVRIPDFKAMAKSALQGLTPGGAQAAGSSAAGKNFLTGLVGGAANAGAASLVSGGSTSDAFAAAGAGLPNLSSLASQFSGENLRNNAVTKLRGALSGATGGLSDLAMQAADGMPTFQSREFALGALDSLAGLFCIGGIHRVAAKKLSKMVGGAYVQAAVKSIDWGTAGAFAETIGAVKLTKAPLSIDEMVQGKLITTVLGKIMRNAGVAISILAKKSAVKVVAAAQYVAGDAFNVSGAGGVVIDAGSQVVLSSGGSNVKLSKGAAVLDTAKMGLSADAKIFINGKNLSVTK